MRPASVMHVQQVNSSGNRIPVHSQRRGAPNLQHGFPSPSRTLPKAESAASGNGLGSNRPRIWAFGFAIIVISGTILGAQLKSRKQAQDRAVVRDSTLQVLKSDDQDGHTPVVQRDSKPGTSTQTDEGSTPSPSLLKSTPSPPHPPAQLNQIDTQKQISFLEERRAALMTQKLGLEEKLAEVRRKQQAAQEMEARKKQELDAGR